MTSINFKNGNTESIYFHTQKDHNELLNAVEDYIQDLQEDEQAITDTPLSQKCPHTTILDFIIWYIGDTDGNEDNNTLQNKPDTKHHTMNLQTQQWEQPNRP